MKFLNLLLIGIMTFAGTIILLKQKITAMRAERQNGADTAA